MTINKIIFISIFSLLPLLVTGRDIYVATNGNSTPPYTTWPNASTNIQWAVSVGTNGDTVWISNGVYVLTNKITVSSNIAICGFGGMPVIDGNYKSNCFYFASYVSGMLSNLFITRGSNSTHGGGVSFSYPSNGVVRNCIFSNNTSSLNGGGMYVGHGTNSVWDCTFVENNAVGGGSASGGGGGLYLDSTFSVIANCTFLTNTARTGGGMTAAYCAETVVTGCFFISNVATDGYGGAYLNTYSGSQATTNTVICSTFSNNVGGPDASGGGGAIYINGGWIISNCCIVNNRTIRNGGGTYLHGGWMRNCTIANNLAEGSTSFGGGIYMDSGGEVKDCIIEGNTSYCGGGVYHKGADLKNCLIRNNIAANLGGGVYLISASSTMLNCTVVSNYAQTNGGGTYHGNGTKTENCIIYFNASADSVYSNYNNEATASFSNCCVAPAITTGIRTNNTDADPQFVNKTADDYNLSRTSPCVNAGVNREWMAGAMDLKGRQRIRDGTVDMGCYEYMNPGTIFTIRGR